MAQARHCQKCAAFCCHNMTFASKSRFWFDTLVNSADDWESSGSECWLGSAGVSLTSGGIKYSGMFVSGKPQGYGLLETSSGQCLQAEFCLGKVNGWGIRFFKDGTEAAGEYPTRVLAGSKPFCSRPVKCVRVNLPSLQLISSRSLPCTAG